MKKAISFSVIVFAFVLCTMSFANANNEVAPAHGMTSISNLQPDVQPLAGQIAQSFETHNLGYGFVVLTAHTSQTPRTAVSLSWGRVGQNYNPSDPGWDVFAFPTTRGMDGIRHVGMVKSLQGHEFVDSAPFWSGENVTYVLVGQQADGFFWIGLTTIAVPGPSIEAKWTHNTQNLGVGENGTMSLETSFWGEGASVNQLRWLILVDGMSLSDLRVTTSENIQLSQASANEVYIDFFGGGTASFGAGTFHQSLEVKSTVPGTVYVFLQELNGTFDSGKPFSVRPRPQGRSLEFQ